MFKKLLSFLFFFSFFIFPESVSAQVVINEMETWKTSGDWIELYSATDVDISNWIVRDTTGDVETIAAGESIGPSTSIFYIVKVGNRLNRNPDNIKLFKSDGTTLVDQIFYGDGGQICEPGDGQSVGKKPDGSSNVVRFSLSTKEATNNSSEDPCPTTTPAPTSTESPTDTPASTPAPTSSPTPTKTPKPTVKSKKTSRPISVLGDDESSEDSIDSMREELNGNEEEEEEGDGEEKKKKISIVAILLIICGVGLVGVSGYSFYVQKKGGYTKKNEENKVEEIN